MKKSYMTRRDFLKKAGLAGSALASGARTRTRRPCRGYGGSPS